MRQRLLRAAVALLAVAPAKGLLHGQAIAQHDDGTAAHRLALDRMVGSWIVAVEFRLSAQGPWENSRATSDIRWTVGGTVLDEDLSGSRQGKSFSSRHLIATRLDSLPFQLVSADSEHGRMLELAGWMSNDSLIFERTWTHPQGYPVRFRSLYRFIGPDAFNVENARRTPDMASWDVSGKKRYERVSR